MLCEGMILAIALFAGVNTNSGIFVIVHFNVFVFCKCNLYYSIKALFIFILKPKIKNKKMTNLVAPIKAVSSQRSEEIEPKAGIAIPNMRGQFAPKEGEIVLKLILPFRYLPTTKVQI
jgi:hypothetical protein